MIYIGIFLYLSVNLYKFMKNGGIFITMNNAEKKAFPIYNQRLAGFLMIDYYGAAEPPVRCGVSHLSGLTEPLH